MMSQFDSWRQFDHKGGQLHNQKNQNAISQKAWLDKEVNAGTTCLSTNQSSMIYIVSRTQKRKYDSTAKVESLHKENKGEGGEESKSQVEPNDESSTSKISKRSCEGIFPKATRNILENS